MKSFAFFASVFLLCGVSTQAFAPVHQFAKPVKTIQSQEPLIGGRPSLQLEALPPKVITLNPRKWLRSQEFDLKGFIMRRLANRFLSPEQRELAKEFADIAKLLGKRRRNREFKESWVGGFPESNPAFAYPDPDMSSIEANGNMDCTENLRRQQKVYWPQFSWQTIKGDESSRIYWKFERDISRIGYDDAGQSWAIICPQKGFGSELFGTLNIEVTVEQQKGWVDEPKHLSYAEMEVVGKVWYSPSARNTSLLFWFFYLLIGSKGYPLTKENAVVVPAHREFEPDEPFFRMFNGTDPGFEHPDFTLHYDEAYMVNHLRAEMGDMRKTGNKNVDGFNEMLIQIFNLVAGNFLNPGQVVAWNIWFNEPEPVNIREWRRHAEYWRHSINVDHTAPTGKDGSPQYYNGTSYIEARVESTLKREIEIVREYLKKYFGGVEADADVFTSMDEFSSSNSRAQNFLIHKIEQELERLEKKAS